MIKVLGTTKMAMRKDEFDSFARELKKRGFADRLPPARAPDATNEYAVVFDPGETELGVLVLERQELLVSVRATTSIRSVIGIPGDIPCCNPVLVGTRFKTEWHDNFQMLLAAFSDRGIWMAGGMLEADLAPVTDPDVIAGNAIALGAMLAGLKADKATRYALDALEVSERLLAALEGISAGNAHMPELRSIMDDVAAGYRKRYENVVRGIRSDAVVCAAMGLVAESIG